MQILHVRNYNFPEASAMKHNRGGATIAIRKNEDFSYTVSTAFCNISDNFCARIGRNIAEGRLACTRSKEHCLQFSNKKELKHYLEDIVLHYGDNLSKLEFVKEI